ncbi:MAG: hypothetical protein K2Q32_04030, partial [Alphaproteobacteria bacterium]|nr:hypothetical protein [Alphaproteobacteria bacterium]
SDLPTPPPKLMYDLELEISLTFYYKIIMQNNSVPVQASNPLSRIWNAAVGVSANLLTQYRRLEKYPAYQKTLKVLDVGMMNSFHLPVMYSIIGSTFGWGAALPLIGVTPIGLVVGLSCAVMAFNIGMRLPQLFPKLGKRLRYFAKKNESVKKYPALQRFLLSAYDKNKNAVITQKAVGLSLLGFAGLSLLSGSPLPILAGAWYGGFSGLSNWLQGLRTEALGKGEDADAAIFKTAYGRLLERTIGRKWTQRTHFPPMLGGISMFGMGLIMTATPGKEMAEILQAAGTKIPVLVGSALFVSTAVFQASRVVGYCKWDGSFGRVLAGAGMIAIATSIAATQGLTLGLLLASASALSNILVARIEDTQCATGKPTPWPFKNTPFRITRSLRAKLAPNVAPSVAPIPSTSYNSIPRNSAPSPNLGGVSQIEKLRRRVHSLPKSASYRRRLAAARMPTGDITIRNRPLGNGTREPTYVYRPKITYRGWNLQEASK